MKNIFFTLFAAILLFACAPVDSYKISGTYNGAPDDGRVYLAQLTDTSIDYIDSVDIKNGRFELVGKQDTPIVRFLFYPLPEGGEDILPMVLENGGISVKIGRNGARVSGTGLNDAMQAYKDEFDDVSRRAEQFFYAQRDVNAMSAEERDSLQAVTDALTAEISQVLLYHMRANIENPIGSFLISTSGRMCPPAELCKFIDSVPAVYRDERFMQFYNVFQDDLLRVAGAIETAEGRRYLNFELRDINDKETLFSTIVENNEYTLLDFWASWCAPCRKAVPELKALHEKYGKKGLAVVSLSLDTDGEAWKKAVADLGMSWTQLCNPEGGSRQVGRAYGVDFIPTVLIIDKAGNIVSRGLEGKALADKIEELMKK
ncbi:MAG: AhpC/TSA family protein [Bacteroidaceae bacterium]|nr:AhpC/TSA family protein [Bacteroidaceae bacterium]